MAQQPGAFPGREPVARLAFGDRGLSRGVGHHQVLVQAGDRSQAQVDRSRREPVGPVPIQVNDIGPGTTLDPLLSACGQEGEHVVGADFLRRQPRRVEPASEREKAISVGADRSGRVVPVGQIAQVRVRVGHETLVDAGQDPVVAVSLESDSFVVVHAQ